MAVEFQAFLFMVNNGHRKKVCFGFVFKILNKLGILTQCAPFTTICSLFYPFFQVIAAEGEQKASRALKEASEVISESSSALQLRYLQVRYPLAFVAASSPPASLGRTTSEASL